MTDWNIELSLKLHLDHLMVIPLKVNPGHLIEANFW